MEGSIDGIVKGLVSYVHSLIIAVVVGLGGMIARRPLRAAIKLHTLSIARPDFNLSGRSLLLFASTLFPICTDMTDDGHWQFWAVIVKGDEHVFKQILIAAAGTCIGLECCVGFITRTPWAGRFRRRVFRAKSAAQRAEILRYLISFFMILASVLVFAAFSLPWQGMYGAAFKILLAYLLEIVVLISMAAAVAVVYPVLSQVNVKAYAAKPAQRLLLLGLRLLAGALPALVALICSYYEMIALGVLAPGLNL
jgi:hypothetical protein